MNNTIQKHFFIILVTFLLPIAALAQTAMNFSNASATGKDGPTQAQVTAAYDNTCLLYTSDAADE